MLSRFGGEGQGIESKGMSKKKLLVNILGEYLLCSTHECCRDVSQHTDHTIGRVLPYRVCMGMEIV